MGSKRLFGFEFNRLGNDLGRNGARLPEIGTLFLCQSFKAAGFECVEFSSEGGKGRFAKAAVGENDFGLSELFEELIDGFGLNIRKDDGFEKIGPKYAPFFVIVLHRITSSVRY